MKIKYEIKKQNFYYKCLNELKKGKTVIVLCYSLEEIDKLYKLLEEPKMFQHGDVFADHNKKAWFCNADKKCGIYLALNKTQDIILDGFDNEKNALKHKSYTVYKISEYED